MQLFPEERSRLAPHARRLLLLDVGYRRHLEALADLLDPDPHDPFPRHHQHFGASLAVTPALYAHVGGLPLLPSDEDVVLYRAIRRGGPPPGAARAPAPGVARQVIRKDDEAACRRARRLGGVALRSRALRAASRFLGVLEKVEAVLLGGGPLRGHSSGAAHSRKRSCTSSPVSG